MKQFFPKSEISVNIENFKELKHFTMPKKDSTICDIKVYERNAKLAIRYTYLKVIISYRNEKFSHYTLQEHIFLTLEQIHSSENGTYITRSIEAIINGESNLPQFQLCYNQPIESMIFGVFDDDKDENKDKDKDKEWRTTFETDNMAKMSKINKEKTVQENRAILKNQLIEEIEKRRTVNNSVLIEVQTSNLWGDAKLVLYNPDNPEEFLNSL